MALSALVTIGRVSMTLHVQRFFALSHAQLHIPLRALQKRSMLRADTVNLLRFPWLVCFLPWVSRRHNEICPSCNADVVKWSIILKQVQGIILWKLTRCTMLFLCVTSCPAQPALFGLTWLQCRDTSGTLRRPHYATRWKVKRSLKIKKYNDHSSFGDHYCPEVNKNIELFINEISDSR